ncbi:MAG: Hpt domain-containing protein [Pseudomonadota bacterium]
MSRSNTPMARIPEIETGQDGEAAPVDLAYLSRFTLGDRDLEREVLELFCTQSVSYLEQLKAATSHKAWVEAAHSLKGSARAVGAWRAARAAERVEALQNDIPPELRTAQVGELEASLLEAADFVARLADSKSS